MELEKIKIKKFKSIDNVEIPLKAYGNDESISKTMFLVGINESGKSNILEAISYMNNGFDQNLQYQSTFCKNIKATKEFEFSIYVDLFFKLSANELMSFSKSLRSKVIIPDELFIKIKISNLRKIIFVNKDSIKGFFFAFDINEDIPYFLYSISGKTISIIKSPINQEITAQNSSSFLEPNCKLLDIKSLYNLIAAEIEVFCNPLIGNVIYWKASPEYLIDNSISLSAFKDDTTISNTLRYIFNIHGEKTDLQIKTSIEKALQNDEAKSELEDELTSSVTNHINSIWKEHQINFKIKFDGDKCKVHVEDKSKAHKYYNMSQRSDGFKQFVSFILTISSQNEASSLKNNIILLDEPEIHLHPSGIRYLRDELLKIGKNNHVIVATHSQFMIDTETMDRHWIVEKNNGITTINQLASTSSINDEVLYKAFGLSFMKELLPENILLVEGYGDKIVFNHVISILDKYLKCTIKPAGGCTKINNVVALLTDEDINTFVLVDADDEGIKCKADLLKNHKNLKGKIFTLKDVLDELPNNCSLEDLYPIDFIKVFFDNKCGKEFTLNTNQAIISQLKNQDDSLKNKDKLEKLKSELSNLFIEKHNNLDSLNQDAPFFSKFINALINIMK